MRFTVSDCINDHLPGVEALSWSSSSKEEKSALRNLIGLSKAQFENFQSQIDSEFERSFGWMNTFYSLLDAREVYQKFFQSVPSVRLVGIATSRIEADAFIEENAPTTDGQGEFGVTSVLRKQQQPG